MSICLKSDLDPIPPHNTALYVSVYHIQKTLQPEETGRERFSADLDRNIEEVDAIPENHKRFVEMLRIASRKHIAKG